MHISGTLNTTQVAFYQADFNYSRTSQYQVTDNDSQQNGSFSSAVTISLSISAINVTTGLRAAEQSIDDSNPNENIPPRAVGIDNALKNLLKGLDEDSVLTGKLAKRFSKLVSILNVARGTDTKPGDLDQESRAELRSARKQINDFFQAKHSTVLIAEDLANFITLVAKVETLREFVLRTTDLLDALKGADNEENESIAQQVSLLNIEV